MIRSALLRKFTQGRRIDEPICIIDVTDSNKVNYYHFDGLGIVVVLSDTNTDMVVRYYYDVFGEKLCEGVSEKNKKDLFG